MREILALLLILILTAISVLNVFTAEKLHSSIEAELVLAECSALEKDWQKSEESFSAALNTWLKAEGYTHIFLRHPEIDSCTDCFYEVQEAIFSQSGTEIQALFGKLRHHLQSIADMEKIRIGNVF